MKPPPLRTNLSIESGGVYPRPKKWVTQTECSSFRAPCALRLFFYLSASRLHIPHSHFRIPHSPFPLPHSAFTFPPSTFRIPPLTRLSLSKAAFTFPHSTLLRSHFFAHGFQTLLCLGQIRIQGQGALPLGFGFFPLILHEIGHAQVVVCDCKIRL